MGAEASAEFVAMAMRSAFEDLASRAVLLSINFPDRRPVQAGTIDDQIRHLEAKCGKPVEGPLPQGCCPHALSLRVIRCPQPWGAAEVWGGPALWLGTAPSLRGGVLNRVEGLGVPGLGRASFMGCVNN